MKKVLLFALAASLGSIAFADPWYCERFSPPNWPVSLKGCKSCPVRENGHFVTCEKVSASNRPGNTDRDCCWLNTPPSRPDTGNCYTNAYVLPGTPWAARCVCILDCLNETGSTGASCAKTCDSGNGGRGGAKGEAKGNKKNTIQKPATSGVKSSKPVFEKQTQVQTRSEKAAK